MTYKQTLNYQVLSLINVMKLLHSLISCWNIHFLKGLRLTKTKQENQMNMKSLHSISTYSLLFISTTILSQARFANFLFILVVSNFHSFVLKEHWIYFEFLKFEQTYHHWVFEFIFQMKKFSINFHFQEQTAILFYLE